jgi:DNA-binding MarR family transcriptional regulator
MPLVLEINALNARQRKALIRDHIPFVMDGVQLYLPFMGILLQERYPAPCPQGERLMPTSQLILFHYLYQKKREMYANGLAGFLGMSAMQVTRAVKQLSALGLFQTQKDGVQIVCTGATEGAALLDKAKPYIQNPASKKIYVEKDVLPQGLPLAGFSALAEYTMLNPPSLTTFAFGGKASELNGTKTLVDAEEQAEVEFWRYPPEMLSARRGFADPLSLWATLPDGDPRTESAKEELLAAAWE